MRSWIVAAAAGALICACAQPAVAPQKVPDSPLPVALYTRTAANGEAVYRLQPGKSVVLARVGRDGALSKLGHDHVIAADNIQGFVLLAEDASRSRADLAVLLRDLVVDNPAYRASAGLDPEVAPAAIEGTYANMQDKVLESGRYPWALISARFASAGTDPPTLSLSMTVHGTTAEFVVPVELTVTGDRLDVSGAFTVLHSDFSLTPFSAAGGLLRVAEQIELTFRLVARR